MKSNEKLIKELEELQEKYNSLAASSHPYSPNQNLALQAHAIRCISECVSITDMENKIIFVNHAFLNTYQYEEHEIVGANSKVLQKIVLFEFS